MNHLQSGIIVAMLFAVTSVAHAEDAIDLELLKGGWTHSYEEDKDFEGKVYRRTDSKRFPVSRFRMRYVFNEDGSGKFLYLHPADAHRMVACQWEVADGSANVIDVTAEVEGKKQKERLEVLELTKDILRIK